MARDYFTRDGGIIMAKLYGVGVGPGDKELLTIKAIKTIGKCDVIVVPSAMNGGKSIAHEIAEENILTRTQKC